MKIFRVAFLLFAIVVLAANADETNLTLTVDGITYSNVVWRTTTPATVSIFHKSGAASIPLEKLPPDLQKRFGYDPKKAADYRAAELAAQAARKEALRKRQDEEDAAKQWEAQLETAKQDQAARDLADQSALATARKRAKEAAAKKREEDFLASLGPVTMIKFSYAGAIRLRADGKYTTTLMYHDDQGYPQSIHCQFPKDGLNFLKNAQRSRHSRSRNGLVVYGRPFSQDTGNVSSVPIDTTSYWLIGMRLAFRNNNNYPSW